MEDTAAKYGFTLRSTDALADIAKQASDIADLVAQGVDYLVFPPQQMEGLQAAVKEAMAAGIPVVLIDRTMTGTPGVDWTCEIMSDFYLEAQQLAEYVIEKTGGKGNVVILQGTPGADSTIQRQAGFVDTITAKAPEMKIIFDQVADYSMEKGQQVMELALQAHKDDIQVVFCHNDDMALGAVKAIEQAGYDPAKFGVVGIDGPKAALQAVKDGKMLASMTCTPLFGEPVAKILVNLIKGNAVEVKMVNPDFLYTVENADPAMGY
jgi:ABC-type sugar transport system substrate-binding protein